MKSLIYLLLFCLLIPLNASAHRMYGAADAVTTKETLTKDAIIIGNGENDVVPSNATCTEDGNATFNKVTTSVDVTPDSDHTATGPQTNDINAGESVTALQCVYLHSDGEWHLADADAEATGGGLLALALETKTDGEAMNVALPGSFVRDDSWDWTVGDAVYLSTTEGSLTQTAPSGTDDVVRILGWATHTDRIYFNPLLYVIHN
jgi:predicted RecA/RadA family phage recombinase